MVTVSVQKNMDSSILEEIKASNGILLCHDPIATNIEIITSYGIYGIETMSYDDFKYTLNNNDNQGRNIYIITDAIKCTEEGEIIVEI